MPYLCQDSTDLEAVSAKAEACLREEAERLLAIGGAILLNDATLLDQFDA